MKVLGTFTIISIAVGAAVDRTPTALELRARRLALKTGQDIPNPDQIDYIINAYNVGVAKNTLNSGTDPMTTIFIVLCEIASGKSVSSDPCREYIEGDKVETAKEELEKLLVLASKIRLAVATEPKVVPLARGDVITLGGTEAAVGGRAVRPTSVHGGSRPILPARTPRADGEGESEAGSGDDTSPASTHETAGGTLVDGDAVFKDEDSAGRSEDSVSSTRAVDGSIRASAAKGPSAAAAASTVGGAGGRRSLLATLSKRGIDTFTKSPDPQRDSAKAGGDASVAGKDGSTEVRGAGVFFEDGVIGYRLQNGNTFGFPLFNPFRNDEAAAKALAEGLAGEAE
jgi:hypothetical protein